MTAPAKTKKLAHIWKRDENDWYVEPSRASEALFRVETFDGSVWDPACGKGNIVYSALAAGIQAYGTDIVNRHPIDPPGYGGELDFLEAAYARADNIVTNPPFYRAKGAEAFIRKALSLVGGKVAAFVDIRFIAGGERARGIFSEFPPESVWIIHPRVSCPPGAYLEAGGKAGNGSSDWCWLVWPIRAVRRNGGYSTELKWLNVKEPTCANGS
jgi:hypothetical protein